MTVFFLETKRLIIKPSSLENVETVYPLVSDPEVMRYVGKGAKTPEETVEGIKNHILHFQKHGFGFGDVYEKATGTFIGNAGLVYLEMDDTQPEIEVGYRLHKAYWNKGYGTELTKALIDWGFKNIPVKKLVAVLRSENEKSRRVLEKAGMRYVGRVHSYNNEVAKYEIYKNDLDFSKLELIPATLNDYPIIQNLARFYSYDISEYYGHKAGWEMEENGLYGVGIDYKQYWETENCFPFIIRYNGNLAGFAIVDKKGSDASINFNMAQFCILRTCKGRGIGKYIAYQCFQKFKGTWEIMVMPGNEGAYRFWRSIIREYTQDNYIEYTKIVPQYKNLPRNFFRFQT